MKPLVIITGPTASGKSDLAVRLAKETGGEIISADSMQVYRGMDIGTAKITTEEMQGVPHHLIDIMDPWEPFDVTIFQKLARKAVNEICERGRLPIVAGGTGFYIQALLYGIEFSDEDSKEDYRKELDQYENDQLFHMLEEVDPLSAQTIHPNNRKRVIRALEYFKIHHTPISSHNEKQRAKKSEYQSAYFVIEDERSVLYERIDKRVDQMIEHGLIPEVEKLKAQGCTKEMTSMQGIGYRQVIDYLEGRASLEEMTEKIKKDTRHFAKRQMTWFRREKDVMMLSRADHPDLLPEISLRLKERGLL